VQRSWFSGRSSENRDFRGVAPDLGVAVIGSHALKTEISPDLGVGSAHVVYSGMINE